MLPEFGPAAEAAAEFARALAMEMAGAEAGAVVARMDEYEQAVAGTLAIYTESAENQQRLALLDGAHRRLIAAMDAEVDRLARGLAGQRRNGRLVNSYFAAHSSSDQHSRSA